MIKEKTSGDNNSVLWGESLNLFIFKKYGEPTHIIFSVGGLTFGVKQEGEIVTLNQTEVHVHASNSIFFSIRVILASE